MGQRQSAVELIWTEGPAAFGFLVEELGFDGPERTHEGLVYRRAELRVEINHWYFKNETGFSTTVVEAVEEARRWASLGCLYVACGLGPLQAVPENSGGGHTIRKRVVQHANALRQVIPRLLGPERGCLLRRCHRRELPEDEA